jgi:CHAT domain-containing protein
VTGDRECDSSGASLVSAGDGVAALARAFFYAGAPSTVAVRDVVDAPTSPLLPAFHRRGSAARTRRFFWAAFVLLGEPK